MARKRQPRIWDINFRKMVMEKIKFRKLTPEFIETLPELRTRKVVRLTAKSYCTYESDVLTKSFKVMIEKYIVHIKKVYKYWNSGAINDGSPTFVLDDTYREALEAMKRLSALMYLVLPSFAKITDYYEALDMAQPFVNLVSRKLNEADRSLVKSNGTTEPMSKDEESHINNLESIYDVIHGHDLEQCSLVLKCMEHVLLKCVEDKAIVDSFNSLALVHMQFSNHIFDDILERDEYKRLLRKKGRC